MSLLDGLGVPDYQPGLPAQTVSASVAQLFTLHTGSDTTLVLREPLGFTCLHMMGTVFGAAGADTVTLTVSNDVIVDHLNIPMVRKYRLPATGFFVRIPCWGTFLSVTARSSVDNVQLTLFCILDSQALYTVQDFTSGPRAIWVNASLPPGFTFSAIQAFTGRALLQAVVPAGTNWQLTLQSKDPGGGGDLIVAQWSQANGVQTRLTADVILPNQGWLLAWNNLDGVNQTVYVTVTPDVTGAV